MESRTARMRFYALGLLCIVLWSSASNVLCQKTGDYFTEPLNALPRAPGSRLPNSDQRLQVRASEKQQHHFPEEGSVKTRNMNTDAPELDSDATPSRVPLLTVTLMTVWMAAMSGVGAIPYFFTGKLKDSWAGIANAVACGVMLAASFDLLHEGAPHSPTLTILGMVGGCLFIKFSQDYLSQYEDVTFEDLQGADARKALLIVGVMAAHAFGEGSGVGVSFSGNRGWAQGTLVTIAIGLHNIPEGMAVATVMMSKGASAKKAMYWTLLCSMPQAIVAVPSYIFVETFQALLPLALGFTAGCMVWVVFAELIPDALASAPHPQVATAATFSAAWLQGLSMLIATLEQPNGTLASPIQADLGYLTSRFTLLAPALLAPVGIAIASGSLLRATPVALGASAGALAALGVLGALKAVLLAGSFADMFGAMGWCAMGAAGAVTLQRLVVGGSSGSGSSGGGAAAEVKRTLQPQLDEVASDPALAQQQQQAQQQWGVGQPYAYPYAPGPAYAGGHVEGLQAKHVPHPPQPLYAVHAADVNGTVSVFGANGHANANGYGGAYGYPPSAANGNVVGAKGGVQGPAGWQQQPLPLQVAIGQQHGTAGRHDPATCSCYNCEAGGGSEWNPKSTLLAGEEGIASASSSHKQYIQAAWLGLAALLLHACAEGASLARKLAVSGSLGETAGHLVLPLGLAGVPVGMIALGLSKALAGASWRGAALIASAASATLASVALCCLLPLPLGRVTGEDLQYDTGSVTDKAHATLSGALLVLAARYLWPAVTLHKANRARAGAWLGVGVVVVVRLLRGALCEWTPYCMPAAQ